MLALIPAVATGLYYLLPPHLHQSLMIQFFPQAAGYVGLAIWLAWNKQVLDPLGLRPGQFREGLREGLRWGLPTGLALGLINVSVMWWIVPWLGHDIGFLRDTPHARVPVAVMLPWCILFLAVAVELNFRGFLLGRMLVLFEQRFGLHARLAAVLAGVVSSLVFSFDPFMVATFKHLHWIALWDGIVWSMIWVRTKNLYATITAHAVEVIMMYSVLKWYFSIE